MMKAALTLKKPKIFICYRREDSTSETGRLFYDLVREFGKGNVFMDVDSLPLGENVPLYLEQTIASCTAVIVIIGKNWLSLEKNGVPRIYDPADQVRQEISCALRLKKVIIPVVVQNGRFPEQSDLPDDIKELSNLNALTLTYGYWNVDVKKLTESLQTYKSRRAIYPLICGLAVLAAVLTVVILYQGRQSRNNTQSATVQNISSYNVHLYPFHAPNFNLDIARFLFQVINEKTSSFNFLIHNQRSFPNTFEEKGTFSNEASKGAPQDGINTDSILAWIKRIHVFNKQDEKETAIALVPYSLHTNSTLNLFSIRLGHYVAISTYDWNLQEYQSVSIYRYLIHQVMKTGLVSLQPHSASILKYHEPDLTAGCVFDYNYEKTAIRNSIVNGTICDQHKQIIKNIFGDVIFKEFEYIITFGWMDKEVIDNMQKVYNVVI